MLKKIVLLSAFIFLLSTPVFADTYRTTTADAKMYYKPGDEDQVITIVPKGGTVKVIGVSAGTDNYYFIRYAGRQGYVESSYLTVSDFYDYHAEVIDGRKIIGYSLNDIIWTLDSNGVLTVSGNGEIIPLEDWNWDGIDIKKVVIESGILNVPRYMFSGVETLTSVEVSDTVLSIEKNAFEDCHALQYVKLGRNVNVIKYRAFYHCTNLKSLVFSDQLIDIGRSAFEGCSMLAEVHFPSTLRSIAATAFYRCNSLTEVTIPGNLNEIGDGAFFDCKNLSKVNNNSSCIVHVGRPSDQIVVCEKWIDQSGIQCGTKTIAEGLITAVSQIVTEIQGNTIAERKIIHAEVKELGAAATCTKEGKTDYIYCKDCKTVIQARKTIRALGHKWDNGTITRKPTVLSKGLITYKCSRDPSHSVTEKIPKVKPTLKLNIKNTVQLKKGQTSKKVKVKGLQAGDAIKKITSNKKNVVKVSFKKKTIILRAQRKAGVATITIVLKSGLKKKFKVRVKG